MYYSVAYTKNIFKNHQYDMFIKYGGAKLAQNNIQNQKLVTKEQSTTLKVEKDLLDSLKSIKSNYDTKMPKIDYGIFKNVPAQDFELPSASQIKKEAEDGLQQYKASQLSKINENYTQNQAHLNEEKQKLNNSFDKNQLAKKVDVNNQINSLHAKNVKQGIIDSSITQNAEKQVYRQYNNDMSELQSDYITKLNAIQLKKDVVEQERANALANFDISYANKLNKQFNTLTKEYTQALKNVQEYQNVIDNKRKEIEDDFQAKYGQTVKKITQDMQREMTLDTFVKLKDLPKSEIQQILNSNPEIKDYLGDWYSALKLWLYR